MGSPVVRGVRARWLVLGLAAAIVVVLAALAWVGVRALMAKSEIDQVTAHIDELRQAVGDGDLGTLAKVADEVAPHVQRADALTGDPIWRATEVVPVLGPNLAAARVSSSQLDVLVNDLALPLMSELPHLGDGKGGIDVATLQKVAKTLQGVDAALQAGTREFAALDLDETIPAVGDGARQLQKINDQAATIVHDTAPFAKIAPGLLGADKKRHILMIVQNNAELRTGGGINGSLLDLTADSGRVTLNRVASDVTFPPTKTPIADVPESTTTLYGDVVGRYIQNTTSPADFTVTAELVSAWWHKYAGTKPDLVVSIDAFVLRAIIKATGPIDAGNITLTADNAVKNILVTPYLTLDAEQQDAYFTKIAKAVFAKATGAAENPAAFVTALQTPLAQGRISAWSRAQDEEAVLGAGMLGGPAARHRAAGKHAYAVYLSDATGSKMDRFLATTITTGSVLCRSDGHQDVTITVTLKNNAPADAATRYSGWVTGGGVHGTPPGQIRTIVVVSAPANGSVAAVTADGKTIHAPAVVEAGFPTTTATVLLKPGEAKSVEFRFIAGATGDVRPVIVHTPMMQSPEIARDSPKCQ
ncbi:DUF4012 domain-containing protein [Microbacterium sp. KR10-403]|uniref:DUF4012 domain-containing protein n=1 Tax=Microbacterium sp. KR10-403 TaxID=3158581 RepID=UPI0032E3FF9E